MNLWGGSGMNFYTDTQVLAVVLFFAGFLGLFAVMINKIAKLEVELVEAERTANRERATRQILQADVDLMVTDLNRLRNGVSVVDLDREPEPNEPGGLSSMFVKVKPRDD